MIKLTPEQIKNWREVLVRMGIIKFIVDKLSDEEIQKMADNMNARFQKEVK